MNAAERMRLLRRLVTVRAAIDAHIEARAKGLAATPVPVEKLRAWSAELATATDILEADA